MDVLNRAFLLTPIFMTLWLFYNLFQKNCTEVRNERKILHDNDADLAGLKV